MTKKASKPGLITAEENEPNSYNLADNLVDLYWFVQIIDAGSFSTAASQHGLSKSNLSRRLSQLETRLGVQLLHRNPRFLTLTSIGTEVYRHTLEMIAAAQKATDSVQRSLAIPSGRVSLILPAILSGWLMPMLLNFQNTYPHIQLSLHSADNIENINAQTIDLALSLFAAPNDSSQIVARPLATLTFINVVSTGIKAPLAAQPIQVSTANHQLNQESPNSLQVSNYLNALEATLAGFGYANLPSFACQTGLKSGDLKYHDHTEDQRTLFAFTQSHRGITLATRVLIDYLIVHVSQSRVPGIVPITQPEGS